MIETSQTVILQHDLGRFTDLAALQAKYPTGRPGDYARLTSTETIFNWVTDAWVDTLVDASSLVGGAMTFDNTDPATLGNPSAGKSFSGTYNNLLWVKDENGKVTWAQDVQKVVNLSYGQSLMEIHRDRVKADSGNTYPNPGSFIMATLKEMDVLRKTKLLYAPFMGTKERVSGVQHFATKGYSAFEENDLVQGTELNQPHLRGNIAPNEVLCMSNGNGESRYLTHPEISFGADEAWSFTFVTNPTGFDGILQHMFSAIVGNTQIRLQTPNIVVITDAANVVGGPSFLPYLGKNAIYSLVAYGNDTLEFYINGQLKKISNYPTSISFARIFGTVYYSGKLHYYRIQSGAISAAQAANEAAALRSIIPEIESVKIGNQEWATSNLDMVCTPMGNVIPEVQLGANEEKVSGGDFESGLVGNITIQGAESATYTLNSISPISGLQDGLLEVTSVGTFTYSPRINFTPGLITTINKYYHVIFDYKINSGICDLFSISGLTGVSHHLLSGEGHFDMYLKSNSAAVPLFNFDGTNLFNAQFDNISFEEVGWAGLGDLYTWLTTEGGYTEADALKEVAAWCYYNNDPANGAIYGKLYNWYAVELLQNDIDAYNAANPGNEWGWRVPELNDFGILKDEVGTDISVSSPKLKIDKEDYYSPSGNNSSGFSALGSGYRGSSGVFGSNKLLTAYRAQELNQGLAIDSIISFGALVGHPVRLIKS